MQFHSFLSAVSVAGFLITTHKAIAGELVPYAPPVSRAVMRAVVPVTTAQKLAVVVPESVYTQFEARAIRLTDEQCKQLMVTFEQSRNDAEQLGDVSRAIYYQRLLAILGRKL